MRPSLALSHVPTSSVRGSRVRRGPQRQAASRIVLASAPSFDGENGAGRPDAAAGGIVPEKVGASGNGSSAQYCFSILRKNRSGNGTYMPKQYGSLSGPNGSAQVIKPPSLSQLFPPAVLDDLCARSAADTRALLQAALAGEDGESSLPASVGLVDETVLATIAVRPGSHLLRPRRIAFQSSLRVAALKTSRSPLIPLLIQVHCAG